MTRVVSRLSTAGIRSLATTSTFVKPVDAIRTLKPRSEQTEADKRLTVTTRHSDKLNKLIHDSIAKGEPHFRVGGKKLYFPTARIILLRPNAKHTPYQAKFIVPKSFNRMDLRDYLYNVYGLRAFNITTQLQHGAFTRDGNAVARYRLGQVKKMTIDMAEPFIWPEEPESKEAWNVDFFNNLRKYSDEKQRFGSDKFKPGTAFDGVLGPYKPRSEPFIPKQLKRKLANEREKAISKNSNAEDDELILRHLGL